MRILLVEDDEVLRDGLMRSLRLSGFAVDTVDNGGDADLALVTHKEYDLLILVCHVSGLFRNLGRQQHLQKSFLAIAHCHISSILATRHAE